LDEFEKVVKAYEETQESSIRGFFDKFKESLGIN
jgi:hypothetical protein